MTDPKTTLAARKLELSFMAFVGLLITVNVQVLSPLAVSVVRRPADNIVNNLNQISLLIAGALCTGAGYFLGNRDEKEGTRDTLGEQANIAPTNDSEQENTL
jgi:hypothetical protein